LGHPETYEKRECSPLLASYFLLPTFYFLLSSKERVAMKCPKCGFVSFDHLSECKKCAADLVAVREGLGFSALRSEVPFLLGTLLSGGDRSDVPPAATAGEEGAPADFIDDTKKPSGEGMSGSGQSGRKSADVAAGDKKLHGSGEDDLVIELSEADLEDLPEMDTN
jgi:hypothetical protein